MHIHCQKGEKECRYWLDSKNYEATEAYGYNMTPKDTRDIKKLIYEYFEYTETEWVKFAERK